MESHATYVRIDLSSSRFLDINLDDYHVIWMNNLIIFTFFGIFAV